MSNLNAVHISGHLSADPKTKHKEGQNSIIEFSIAVNRKYKNASKELQSEVNFVDCVAFGRNADIIKQYCAKGKHIIVSGRLKQDRWQNSEGKNRSKMMVVVQGFHFLDSKNKQEISSSDESSEETTSTLNFDTL